ncbi:flagellar hook capping FlgD N-terminal domain-containing protein [Pluralibacter gergoviae]
MQNQDPTNPMDNNQLTSQLAQFNTAPGSAILIPNSIRSAALSTTCSR